MNSIIDETPWMTWLRENIGQKEVPGQKSNPFILDMFNYTSLKGHDLSNYDSTAWCAACLNAALVKTGYLGTNSAAAASFDTYGTGLLSPRYGAILTLSSESRRHVTCFVERAGEDHFLCIGGNQRDMIRPSLFPKSSVVSIRWPVKKVTPSPS
jgi:uncharacterized protein (TIGR02594 family)